MRSQEAECTRPLIANVTPSARDERSLDSKCIVYLKGPEGRGLEEAYFANFWLLLSSNQPYDAAGSLHNSALLTGQAKIVG